MALFDIRFTEQQRKQLQRWLIALIFGQAAIGLALFLLGVCVSSSIGANLHSVDRIVVDWVFTVLAMYGLYVLTHNLVGAKLCSNFIRFAEGSGMSLRLFVWTLVGIIVVGVGCVLGSVSLITADHLISQIRRSLNQGMMQYLADPKWKRTLDKMQVQMKCCGIESFTDWHKIFWMRRDVFEEDSSIILEYAELDGRVLPPVVPWSCCRFDVKSPCYHDPFQLQNPEQDLAADTLHVQGCLTAMKGPVLGALFTTVVLLFLQFVLQVVIILLSRLTFTAARNAVALGNRNGQSSGWIYGRLDFGNATGPNLYQIHRKCSGRGDVLVDLKPLVYTSDTE
ncbi:photoreceptor outer segment membrane glycoprotein 2 [Athalia rosae]|uniref:photoreceptor outer segment membrane glycoprotein 2 n=1 Tax=Athalia rosae TaxID=37344 RepID=UPI00203446F8|nr:photoreceptor outer segment membrane glycoprotein 2 [Athalia rosae]